MPCLPLCVEDGFSFMSLLQFLEVHESGPTASALFPPPCLTCWPQGFHAGDVTTAALEIMKVIMDVALLGVPPREGTVGS